MDLQQSMQRKLSRPFPRVDDGNAAPPPTAETSHVHVHEAADQSYGTDFALTVRFRAFGSDAAVCTNFLVPF